LAAAGKMEQCAAHRYKMKVVSISIQTSEMTWLE